MLKNIYPSESLLYLSVGWFFLQSQKSCALPSQPVICWSGCRDPLLVLSSRMLFFWR